MSKINAAESIRGLACFAVIITSLISSIFYIEYIDDLSINIGKKIEKIILK